MSTICSICFLLSPCDLTPLFTYNQNKWNKTGLLGMLEVVAGKKIIKENEAQLSICNDCMKNVIVKYFNIDEKSIDTGLDFPIIPPVSSAKYLTISSPDEKENPRKKIKLSDDVENDARMVKFEDPVDLINSLDRDCLEKIFSYLSIPQRVEIEEVCTRWRNISEVSWRNTKEFTDSGRDIVNAEPELKKILLRCGSYLKELNLSNSPSSNIMQIIKKNCWNLEKLTLLFEEILEKHFVDAFVEMKKLQHIKISIDECDATIIGDHPGELNAEILHSLPEGMKEIILKGHYIDDEYPILKQLPFVLEKFNDLCQLTLTRFNLDDNAMAAILQKTTLVRLKLKRCQLPITQELTSNLTNLENLDLHSSDDIDGMLFVTVNTSKNLKYLNLKCCHISDDTFQEIEKFKNIEYLNLSGMNCITDRVLLGISRKCITLKTLNLDSSNIPATAFRKLYKLINLESLFLPGIKDLDDEVILKIANKCKKIKELELNSSENVTSDTLRQLGNLVNLKYLRLMEIPNIDDSVIDSIANKCPGFERLHIFKGENITDSSIMTLINKCPNLKDLMLYYSEITLKTLICAFVKTECRQNNIVLNISGISHELVNAFNRLNIKSPSLHLSGSNYA